MRIDDLDSQQRTVVEAVIRRDAKLLVLGGPGTGKTTTALWAARTYLESQTEAQSAHVLFLTFSRTAVGQILTRSKGVISGFEERVEISTFHALSYRLLRALGRYSGFGTETPTVQTEARGKLLGYDGSKLKYGDLISGALDLLGNSTRIRELLSRRWGLVICDEAQDTDSQQWKLLQALAPRKLLLLGDANQMIYTFIPGVSPSNFNRIREQVDCEIELSPRSHRDPSGAIPALADAIRRRDFTDGAVLDALKGDRLAIHYDVDAANIADFLLDLIKDERGRGSREIGIFVHSNAAVAELGEQLDAASVNYVLVGTPEAHAEALRSMAVQCAFGAGLASSQNLRQSLGLFLTASVRQRQPPYLARALAGLGQLPEAIEDAIQQLELDLTRARVGPTDGLVQIATESWESLRVASGRRPWGIAASQFRRLTGPTSQMTVSEDAITQLLTVVDDRSDDALINVDYTGLGTIKIMNYHQTKGREADTVIHVFRSDDYFGREGEPFRSTSRLLNVAISRARKRVIILLPSTPHSLVRPFTRLRNL